MKIDDLTLGDIKQIQQLFPVANRGSVTSCIKVGDKVFVRTVTMYFTGRVKTLTTDEIELSEAAWIADSGCRFGRFLKDGPSDKTEIEPYPDGVVLLRGAVVDISPWLHTLPQDSRP